MPTPQELADQYLAGAARLRAAVDGMTREQLLARPVAGRWSTMEVVCHLSDFDLILADRMKRIIAMAAEVPLLLVADEDLFVKGLGYHTRDLEEELAVVESIRRQMARIISGLTPEQLQLTGNHNKRGLMTLEKVIGMATNHIPHHVSFVMEKRKALGL
ncbi:DinB family protein [Gemmata sp. JC717]|uniref:DinB family protein n=1 Tax=Gemmata algarum TaxID=2975278 RepID=A0ABU5F230_9BACT|nr:DinB family protein [Gemmata algarum]MDY3553081.1 DinB family protein [Gemmata algarum]MDY3561244.1 DinB family protein [Gemmata algarum]